MYELYRKMTIFLYNLYFLFCLTVFALDPSNSVIKRLCLRQLKLKFWDPVADVLQRYQALPSCFSRPPVVGDISIMLKRALLKTALYIVKSGIFRGIYLAFLITDQKLGLQEQSMFGAQIGKISQFYFLYF